MKKLLACAIVITLGLSITACSNKTDTFKTSNEQTTAEENSEDETDANESATDKVPEENKDTDSPMAEGDGGTKYEKDFGTYTIPAGWFESELYSTEEKPFYIAEGNEKEKITNNISINVGVNKYAADDHMSFRNAIVQQLGAQLGDNSHAKIEGNSSETDNGYIVYRFTITEDNTDVITNQYYIVGEKRYVLVHETTFGEHEDTDKMANAVVNSFVWAE